MTDAPLLEVRKVAKHFPGVRALRDVHLTLQRGELLAVIGENGAGKSTLMKILAGVQTPNSGEILFEGAPIELPNVQAAQQLGIALIHQELNLAGNLDIGANIYLGREPRRFGFIDRDKIRTSSRRVLTSLGLDLDPDQRVDELSIGLQQLVEIAKALASDARVLIMDEPTSSLTQHESSRLFKVIKDLCARGVSVVYISHRLSEVKELADRVTVLRDGENAGELARDEINHDAMVRLMVGRDLSQYYQHSPCIPGAIALQAVALRTPAHPSHEIHFTLHAGEIVALAGLVGAGRTELLQALFGVAPAIGGEIRLGSQPVLLRSPIDAIRAGIALVPEDRKAHGLILEMAVRENLSLASLRRDQRHGFLNADSERRVSDEMIPRLSIKTPSPEQPAQLLSGGNQQKIVLGKWLALQPRVLLLDEPTRGIDIGAKREIYGLMEKLAAQGVAILFVSSEMEEVLGMAERVLVMHEGRIAGELSKTQLNEEAVMQLATGRKQIAA